MAAANGLHSGTKKQDISKRELAHGQLARKAAAEGMALLKNDGLLPLDASASVALFGSGAARTVKGGTGSGDVNNRGTISIYQGFQDAGITVTSESWLSDYGRRYEDTRNTWKETILEDAKGMDNPFDAYSKNPFLMPDGRRIAETDLEGADVAVYVISRISGEGKDRRRVEGDYYLSRKEREDLFYLNQREIPVVLLLNVGSVVELTDILQEAENIRAILHISLPGQEGGHAVADVLFGKATPGGRLTATWARRYGDYPSAENYSHLNGNLGTEEYQEGIYVGYRYFDSFGIQPLFPFGYGLSYTEFSMEPLGVKITQAGIEVSVMVKNTGERWPGREVVQVYVSPPRTGMAKECHRLAGFAKTAVLPPKAQQRVTVAIGQKQLASFSEGQHAWIIEDGKYGVWIGKHIASLQPVAVLDVSKQVVLERTHEIHGARKQAADFGEPGADAYARGAGRKNSGRKAGNETSGWGIGNGTSGWKAGNETSGWKAGNETSGWKAGSETSGWNAGSENSEWAVTAGERDILVIPYAPKQEKGISGKDIPTEGISAERIPAGNISYEDNQEIPAKNVLSRDNQKIPAENILSRDNQKIPAENISARDNQGIPAGNISCGCNQEISAKNVSARDNQKIPAEEIPVEELIPLLYGNITPGASTLGSAGVRVPGSAGETTEALEAKYGKRSLIMADGPAGLRLRQSYEVDRKTDAVYGVGVLGSLENGFLEEIKQHEDADTYYQYCTAFPVGTALAQTWDTGLMQEFGRAIAAEMEEFHVDLWLAPGMNIHRNPLCGRNFEYYSEDPLLTGIMAAAVTDGVQGNGKCGVTVKHFACNNQEDNRMAVNACVSERALREIYFRGFEIAVKKSAPAAMMSAYNCVNGIHAANSRDLCQTVARDEWGFEGVILSDWNTTVPEDGSVPWQCIAAGNDLIMPGNRNDDESIRKAYAEGKLSETAIRTCAGRVLAMVERLSNCM